MQSKETDAQVDESDKTSCKIHTESEQEWKPIQHKRSPRKFKNLIEGTCEDVEIKGVSKSMSYHVCRLEPNLTEDKLEQYLISKNIKDVICEKLQSKWPQLYSSFKITVPSDEKICEEMLV